MLYPIGFSPFWVLLGQKAMNLAQLSRYCWEVRPERTRAVNTYPAWAPGGFRKNGYWCRFINCVFLCSYLHFLCTFGGGYILSNLKSSVRPINGTLTGTITPGRSGPGSNTTKTWVHHQTQFSVISRTPLFWSCVGELRLCKECSQYIRNFCHKVGRDLDSFYIYPISTFVMDVAFTALVMEAELADEADCTLIATLTSYLEVSTPTASAVAAFATNHGQ